RAEPGSGRNRTQPGRIPLEQLSGERDRSGDLADQRASGSVLPRQDAARAGAPLSRAAATAAPGRHPAAHSSAPEGWLTDRRCGVPEGSRNLVATPAGEAEARPAGEKQTRHSDRRLAGRRRGLTEIPAWHDFPEKACLARIFGGAGAAGVRRRRARLAARPSSGPTRPSTGRGATS